MQRLRNFLDERVVNSNYREYFVTYNLGIDGETSEGLLKRFEQETQPRISPEEEIIFVFHIGDNDSLFNNKTKKHLVSLENYEKNTKEIISRAKKYSTKVIFIGSFSIDASKTDPVPLIKNHSYKNEYLSQFRKRADKVCKETKCHFINLNKHFETNEWIKYLPDGVHPNTAGYEKTFKIIKDFFNRE